MENECDMTKDVLIRISGLQQMEDDSDDVEVITTGEYFLRNGKHFIVYEETIEGCEGGIRNIVKVTPDSMDIRKQGMASAHMVFQQDQKKMTHYATPMGELVIEIYTNQIQVEEREDNLRVSVKYSLDINYQHVSDCRITMDVCSREGAELRLQ